MRSNYVVRLAQVIVLCAAVSAQRKPSSAVHNRWPGPEMAGRRKANRIRDHRSTVHGRRSRDCGGSDSTRPANGTLPTFGQKGNATPGSRLCRRCAREALPGRRTNGRGRRGIAAPRDAQLARRAEAAHLLALISPAMFRHERRGASTCPLEHPKVTTVSSLVHRTRRRETFVSL